MLSAAKKRYLFAIYELGQTGKPIRSKDIASSLKLKPPSVSKMLNALSEDDLIEKEFYGTVTFTQSGAAMANQLYILFTGKAAGISYSGGFLFVLRRHGLPVSPVKGFGADIG